MFKRTAETAVKKCYIRGVFRTHSILVMFKGLRIHCTILKTSNKTVWSNTFLISKNIYILKVYSLHYTLRKNTNVKKLSFGESKQYNKCPIFSFVSSNSSQFTFNSRFLYELKHEVRLSKSVCGIFHFRFCFIFIKVYFFVQQNIWTL